MGHILRKCAIILLLCLTILHLLFESILGLYPFQKYTVRVVNGIDNEPITVRCQSKDDDLGTHVLRTGEEFRWKFKINFMMSTLYFCHFYWENRYKSVDTFKIGYAMCDREYTWVVTKYGFYKGCDGKNLVLSVGW
ncbi:hypothetical protein RND81_14G210700 [Saponaria officinalis]|uniref:S-protein homolog n=1 Tax=Saponaria officinalis TaxID=3572 RepID=A0AAW1GPM8_SAPOF